MERARLTVDLNLDPVPGAFHTPDSAQEQVQKLLDGSIPHYQPHVHHAGDEGTWTCWAGYLPDHHFEEEEVNCTYAEARDGVLDALEEEGKHAWHEADVAYSEGDKREHKAWSHWTEMYLYALRILQQTPEGEPFDVNIRDERFAVVPNA